MRPLLGSLLLVPALAAQEAGAPDPRPPLGVDPAARILLVPPGCWDGLLLGAAGPLRKVDRRRTAGATVEVWDLALRESPRHEAFSLYLQHLRERLTRGFAAPPPSHGKIELAELVFSDPSNPQKLDLTRVKSLQERYNRLPPSGSPVRK